MWTGRGGSQKFQTLCGHPLWMTPYESSGSQFIRTNTGIQSGPEAFDESMLVMTFLTNLGITEICSFRLVLEEKASKEIPELSQFLEKFLEKSFAFIEFRRQHWPLSRRVMADLPLWRTILAIPRKLRQLSLCKVMDSLVLLAYVSLANSGTLCDNYTLDLEHFFYWYKRKMLFL